MNETIPNNYSKESLQTAYLQYQRLKKDKTYKQCYKNIKGLLLLKNAEYLVCKALADAFYFPEIEDDFLEFFEPEDETLRFGTRHILTLFG